MKQADGKYAVGRKLGTFVIMRDAHGRADQLRGLAQKQALERVSLCIGDAGPRYAVAPEAEPTAVVDADNGVPRAPSCADIFRPPRV